MKKLAVFVDTQIDFLVPAGKLFIPQADCIIGGLINYGVGLSPEEYYGVFRTFDTHQVETYGYYPESEKFPIHCVEDSVGWMNVVSPEMINPDISVFDLKKFVFDMWDGLGDDVFDTDSMARYDRDNFFEDIKRHVDTIEIVGVASDVCVDAVIEGFLKRNFKVQVVECLTMGINTQIAEIVDEKYDGEVTLL